MNELNLLNGRYELLNRIGSGGMASVFRGKDTRLGRLVAVKMLHEGLMDNEIFVRQFQHEAHAAANLTHPNIVTVHDMGQDRDRFYIIMEYVEGRTLKQVIRDYIARGEPMPVQRVLTLAIQICKGIGYAHRAGLVHCDVKPQNILITADDRVKVADFGIARAMTQVGSHGGETIWGTPQYLPPEQAAGEAPTPASDVYSIGVLLFEMLTNALPFSADNPTAIAIKHMREEPPDVQALNPAVPRQLAQIVQKVLSKEPAGRYRTAGQLSRILSHYQEQNLEMTGPIYAEAAPAPTGPLRQVAVPAPLPRMDGGSRPAPHRPEPLLVRPLEGEAAGDAVESDLVAVMLGVAALLLLLGLIPLWYLVGRAWGIF